MFSNWYLEYIKICTNKQIHIIGVFSDWDFLLLGFSPIGLFSIGLFSIGLFSIGVFSVHHIDCVDLFFSSTWQRIRPKLFISHMFYLYMQLQTVNIIFASWVWNYSLNVIVFRISLIYYSHAWGCFYCISKSSQYHNAPHPHRIPMHNI